MPTIIIIIKGLWYKRCLTQCAIRQLRIITLRGIDLEANVVGEIVDQIAQQCAVCARTPVAQADNSQLQQTTSGSGRRQLNELTPIAFHHLLLLQRQRILDHHHTPHSSIAVVIDDTNGEQGYRITYIGRSISNHSHPPDTSWRLSSLLSPFSGGNEDFPAVT